MTYNAKQSFFLPNGSSRCFGFRTQPTTPWRWSLVLLLFLLVVSLTSANTQLESQHVAHTPDRRRRAQQSGTAAGPPGHAAFASALTTALYAKEEDSRNQCSSALSISMAMSLLYPIMTELAASQVRSVFGYESTTGTSTSTDLAWESTIEQINSVYGQCTNDDNANDTSSSCTTVSLSSSVWVDNSNTVSPSWATLLGERLHTVDFSNSAAADQINAWVNASTNGLIESIVPPSQPLTPAVAVALQALYVKAAWATPFARRHTTLDAFSVVEERTDNDKASTNATIPFVHAVERYRYSHASGTHQMVQVPLYGGTLSMVFALPLRLPPTNATATNNPNNTIDNNDSPVLLDTTTIVEAIPQLQSQRVALALPKFEFERTYQDSLKASLQDLGVQAPFQSGALCLYENNESSNDNDNSTICNAAIDVVIQKTFLRLDEEGIEAAAVTALISTTSIDTDVPVLFQADQPFQFFLYDATTQLVLLEGVVGAPEVVTGNENNSTPAVSTAHHDDSDFWDTTFSVEAPIRVYRASSFTAAPATTTLTPTNAPVTLLDPDTDTPNAMISVTMAPTTATPAMATTTTTPTPAPSKIPSASWAHTHRGAWTTALLCGLGAAAVVV